MHPWLFESAIPTWGVVITSVVIGLIVLGHLLAKKDGGYPKDLAFEVAIIIFAGHTVGGRIGYVRANWGRMDSWREILDVTSGGSAFIESFSLIVGSLALYLWWRKIPIRNLFDLIAPLVPTGQAVGRFACIAAGCCYGKPTDMPWGITFTHPETLAPPDVALHPTQVYEMLYATALAAFLWWLRPRRKFRGQVALTYLTIFPLFRFVVDGFRGDPKRGWFWEDVLGQTISNPQALSILMLLGVAVGWYVVPRMEHARNLDVSGEPPK